RAASRTRGEKATHKADVQVRAARERAEFFTFQRKNRLGAGGRTREREPRHGGKSRPPRASEWSCPIASFVAPYTFRLRRTRSRTNERDPFTTLENPRWLQKRRARRRSRRRRLPGERQRRRPPRKPRKRSAR